MFSYFYFYLTMPVMFYLIVFFSGCPSGFFGRNCSEMCSGNCLHKSTCNVTTGYCDDGCAPGWSGADCSEGMAIVVVSITFQSHDLYTWAHDDANIIDMCWHKLCLWAVTCR